MNKSEGEINFLPLIVRKLRFDRYIMIEKKNAEQVSFVELTATDGFS